MGSRCNGLAMCPQEGGPPSLVQLWMMLLHANQPVPVSPELKGVVQRQIYRLIVPDDNVYTYMHVYIYIQPTTRAHWYWNGIPSFFHGIHGQFHQNKARFHRLHQMSRRRPQQHDRPGRLRPGDFLWMLNIENIVMKQIWQDFIILYYTRNTVMSCFVLFISECLEKVWSILPLDVFLTLHGDVSKLGFLSRLKATWWRYIP